jgi:small nuclear ribonucleoprotein (snRNP)-like protein
MEDIEEKINKLSVNENPEIDWLNDSVLGKSLKIILNDTREISGRLQCVDHLGNVVLISTTEYIPRLLVTRALGNVIIPAKGITNIFLETSKFNTL